MYEKILIGYDDSEYSLAAVKEISAWLGRHGGEAELIHGVCFDEDEFSFNPEILKKRVNDGHKACSHAQQTAADFGISLPVQSAVREGDPHDILVNVAEENGADMIALGTYGRKGISKMIIGSVTARVILDAPCDVLVVKRPCDGNCAGRYASILVPFDGSPSSRKALDTSCRLAKLDGSEVTALYVIPRYEELLGFFKTESVKNSLYDEAEKVLVQAQDMAREHGVTVRARMEEGHTADKIAEVAAAEKTALIIMGTYGWKGLDKSIMGSTAERVIMNANCPVLVTR